MSSPVLLQFRAQQKWLRDLADPPILRQFRAQQKWLRDLADPPILRQFREQQKWLRDLADPPILRQLQKDQRWAVELTRSTAFADIAAWQLDLSDRLEHLVENAHQAPDRELSGDDIALALGFDSAPELIWGLDAVVKGLSALGASMYFARATFGFPISEEILYAIVMWVAVSVLAIHLVSGPPQSD